MILGLFGSARGKGRDQAIRHCDWRTERLAGPHPRHRSQGQTHRVSEIWGPDPGFVPLSVEPPDLAKNYVLKKKIAPKKFTAGVQ